MLLFLSFTEFVLFEDRLYCQYTPNRTSAVCFVFKSRRSLHLYCHVFCKFIYFSSLHLQVILHVHNRYSASQARSTAPSASSYIRTKKSQTIYENIIENHRVHPLIVIQAHFHLHIFSIFEPRIYSDRKTHWKSVDQCRERNPFEISCDNHFQLINLN